MSEKKDERRYRDNPIDGFRNGVCLDLRVRIAIDLLTHGGLFEALIASFKGKEPTEADMVALPKVAAVVALESAAELLRLAEERGLVDDFPEGAEIGRGLRDHARRQANFQTEGNREAQRIAAEQLRPASPLVMGQKPS